MSENKSRDIILLAVVGLLAAVALLPDRKPTEETEAADQAHDALVNSRPPSSKIRPDRAIFGIEPDAAKPIQDIPHEYLPLVVGSSWIYRVNGPKGLIRGDTWTMKVQSLPNRGEPGIIETGFDDKKETARVWLDGPSLRFDGLPFTEPMESLNGRPAKTSGELLPAGERIGQDAVWIHEMSREATYEHRDEKGRPLEIKALAKQKDRAHAQEFEKITVPAGQFTGWRVDWISRIEISAKGRPVLEELTIEPFRKETMWIVSGIGIVRRRINYTSYRDAQISMDLIRYERPKTAEPSQSENERHAE